ncbi:phosphoadenosine phosphosulfate reductase family protein (plasmid) [Deinococcus radiomollis]|uniref:phosphoadenosine phosphosulfate reductase domain-containing protein n=1 Tax=Deinococcus radiomollis TaxID=468916 RepID=UPI0038925419
MTHIPDQILRAADQGALFAVNDSGGKDSAASGLAIKSFVDPSQILVLHATLGESEWPGALEQARTHAEHIGAPFMVVQAKKTFLEMVEHRFQTRPEVASWPSPAIRTCTSDLKSQPLKSAIKRYAKEHEYTTVVNVMGLRAEESQRRASKETCVLSERDTIKPKLYKNGHYERGREWLEYLPIHDLTTEVVFGTIADAGLAPHYAYSLGNERVSCVLCIMGCRSDLQNGARHNSSVYQKYAQLEERTGWTFSPSRKTLPELTGIPVESC